MFIKVMKSKLHRATVTASSIDYPGSIAIDPELMEAAGLVPYEAVLVADIENGQRLQTYVIPAKGSGNIEILGAAAKLINKGDKVIIISFAYYTHEEASSLEPKVVLLDDKNRIK